MKPPVEVTHLFAILDQKLLALLGELTPEEWQKPTIARHWTVKDIAAHLLDGNIRGLSMSRDGYSAVRQEAINADPDLVSILNGLNAEWVTAMKRVSPQLLLQLLATTGEEYTAHLASLNPTGKALFPVAWAGEEESENWFHVAREYTEKWLHQQQIRHALQKPGILTKELFQPFVHTLLLGLPYAYRMVMAPEGTAVKVTVGSEAGGTWYLVRQEGKWLLQQEITGEPIASVTMDPETAWKLFSKGMTAEAAERTIAISGDKNLGRVTLSMVAVMA